MERLMNETMESGMNLTAKAFIDRYTRMFCKRRKFNSSACDESTLYITLLGRGFVVIFCLAMIGNAINLLIYNSNQIKYYLAIRMLCTRLLMNTLTMFCLLPNALRILHVWTWYDSWVDDWYWKFWPTQSFLGNLFGFAAMWMTVLMTAECYLHIFMPVRSKSICNKRNLHRCHIIIMVTGTVLALIYPINRVASIQHDRCNRSYIKIEGTTSGFMGVLEQLHTLGNLMLALILPLGLLAYMSFSIGFRMRRRKGMVNTHFSTEKRCVTRITLITTLLQFADFPSVIVFFFVAIRGPAAVEKVCALHTIGLFLGLCNMSLSFYVFFAFSPRFREMVLEGWKELCFRILPSSVTRVFKGRYPQSPCIVKYTESTGLLLAHGTISQVEQLSRCSSAMPEDTFL